MWQDVESAGHVFLLVFPLSIKIKTKYWQWSPGSNYHLEKLKRERGKNKSTYTTVWWKRRGQFNEADDSRSRFKISVYSNWGDLSWEMKRQLLLHAWAPQILPQTFYFWDMLKANQTSLFHSGPVPSHQYIFKLRGKITRSSAVVCKKWELSKKILKGTLIQCKLITVRRQSCNYNRSLWIMIPVMLSWMCHFTFNILNIMERMCKIWVLLPFIWKCCVSFFANTYFGSISKRFYCNCNLKRKLKCRKHSFCGTLSLILVLV